MRDFSRDKTRKEYIASGKTIPCKFTGAFSKVSDIKIVTIDGFLCMQTETYINGRPLFTLSFWMPQVGKSIFVDDKKVVLTDIEIISTELETHEFMDFTV